MNANDEQANVVVECAMERPPETVWRAITQPALVREWLGVEHRAEAEANAASWEIVEAQPFARLRYRWDDPSSDPRVSFVTFELSPLDGGGTFFRLTHAATARAPVAANTNRASMLLAA